ncbi:hypothetical protein QL285_036048 [Trifolium repens]|nr:hypothetical protein QL285_036048 [Trifolium repens]
MVLAITSIPRGKPLNLPTIHLPTFSISHGSVLGVPSCPSFSINNSQSSSTSSSPNSSSSLSSSKTILSLWHLRGNICIIAYG